MFADLFARHGRPGASRAAPRRRPRPSYLIDSTGVRLSGAERDWARFSARRLRRQGCTSIYDPDADRPIYVAVTAANVNDITAAKAMPIEPGATYVFDLGYYDYGWWAKLDAAGLPHRHPASRPTRRLPCVDENCRCPRAAPSSPTASATCRRAWPAAARTPSSDPVREVRVRIETGKVLRILANDLDAPAEEIADLYKRRWADRAVLPLGQADPEDHATSSAPPRTPCASRSPSP